MTDQRAPHLDLDALADALAGEGDGATHLDGCASCTSRLAELAAADRRVSAALATLPAPPVPAGLADRLTAALAAEPPLSPSTRSATASVTALPSGRARRTWLPAAAAAVLVVSGAGLGYSLLSDGRGFGGNDASTAADVGAAGPDLVLNASGTDYGDPAAVASVLPGVLAGSAGSVELSREAEAREEDSAGAATATEMADEAQSAQAPASEDPLARLRTTDALADCLTALLPPEEPDVQPLALDYAQYQGQPALAVVLPEAAPDKLSVFVVGPGCSQADDSLLHFFRIDAP